MALGPMKFDHARRVVRAHAGQGFVQQQYSNWVDSTIASLS